MTLLFMDGFDHYSSAQINRKWGGTSGGTLSMQAGRFAGQSFRLQNTAGNVVSGIFSNTHHTVILGMAINWATYGPVVLLRDNGTAQVELRINGSGQLYVTRNGTVIAGPSTNSISINTWYYVEFKVKIDNSAGTVEVRVNGTSTGWINATGLDTQNTANAYVNQIVLTNNGTLGIINNHFDDLYFLNTLGTRNNNFLGDSRIETLYPTGAGNSTQWTPNTGNNWAAVDEPGTQDDDTTYISSQTVGHKDTYGYGNLASSSGYVAAVQTDVLYRVDTSGTRSVVPVTRSGGSEADGNTITVSSATYAVAKEIQELNPLTTAEWTRTEVNAAEFGVKVTA